MSFLSVNLGGKTSGGGGDTEGLDQLTVDYVNAMTLAGDNVSTTARYAFNDFVLESRLEGSLPYIVFFAPNYGSKLSGAMVKFIVDDSGTRSMVPVNLSESDYVPYKGYNLTSNTNKRVQTGLIPANNGLTKNNILLAAATTDYTLNSLPSGSLVGDNPPTGGNNISIEAGAKVIALGPKVVNVQVGNKRSILLNVELATTANFFLGAGQFAYDTTTGAAGTGVLDSEVTLFQTTGFGSIYRQIGSLSYVLFAKGMPKVMAKKLSVSLYRLYEKLGVIDSTGGVSVFFGDSITAAQSVTKATDAFSTLVSIATGTKELNLGMPGSELTRTQQNIVGGFQRYQDIFSMKISNLFIAYGANDMRGADSTTNGDPVKIEDFGSKIETIIQDAKNAGIKTHVISPPYNTDASITKQNAYQARLALAAINKKVPFVDVFNAHLDTGSTATYLSDSVHLNTAGHALAADAILTRLRGVLIRKPTLDFSSIAAGASVTLTATVPTASTDNSGVSVFPLTPVDGILFSATVTAIGIVTVKAFNPTASSIDPPATKFTISVNQN
jgi:lysophospholipase L1-like esterase